MAAVWRVLILQASLISCIIMVSTSEEINPLDNSTDPNKDMYVIHATVYQVGIITNKSDDNMTDPINLGNQESVTFFHNNGSSLDLSAIPTPLMTNVTAQRVVGVSPRTTDTGIPLPLTDFKELGLQLSSNGGAGQPETRIPRDIDEADMPEENDETTEDPAYSDGDDTFYGRLFQRSVTLNGNTPVKIEQGSVAIPPEANVQSLAIPPLLTFNNNYSDIPVPVPNMSVVQYAKINTLVKNVPFNGTGER